MKLTQKQEWIIARHLRDAEMLLGDVSDVVRTRTLARMKKRVYQQLERELPANTTPRDEDVLAILQTAGTLSGEAIEQLGKETTTPGKPLTLNVDDCWWLGVCGGIGKHFEVRPGLVRAGFILAGLLTGPIAICAYLFLYSSMYFVSDAPEVPPINPFLVVWRVLGTVVVIVVLHVCTEYAQILLMEAYCRWIWKGEPPALKQWDWLTVNAPTLLAGALMFLVPLAVLSGFPLANQWGDTWKKVVHAGLAVYAVILSCGLASYLVGIILHGVEVFMG